MKLTPRMTNWIEQLGVHAVVATPNGFPTVFVTESCRVDGETIRLPLSEKQKEQIAPIIEVNSHVAIAPGLLGSVRAPYQFKGRGAVEGGELAVRVDRIYCTKPGYEAGIRMDCMGYDEMKEYEESRWKDINPPRK